MKNNCEEIDCSERELWYREYLRDHRFSLSDKSRSYLIKYSKRNADFMYSKVYNIIVYLPKSLQIDWLKSHIFEINEKLSNSINPRPESYQDLLDGSFLGYFVFSQTYTKNQEALEESIQNKDIDDLLPLNGRSEQSDILLPPKIICIQDFTGVYNGDTDLEAIVEEKGLNHTTEKSLTTIEKALPLFGEITNKIANLIFYEYLLASFRGMERGEEMQPPPPKQLQTDLTLEQRGKLFDMLAVKRFIPTSPDVKENFVWPFGQHEENQPSNWKPIEWKGKKNLLAYFVDKFNIEILGNERIKWLPFEKIFNQNGLNGAKNDYQKIGTLPQKSKTIDTIINEIIK